MAPKLFEELSFVIIDYIPEDFCLPETERSKVFMKRARKSSLLVLVKWRKKWLGGIVCSRINDQPGLLLSCYAAYALPPTLRLFLFNLTMEICAKANQEELECPPKIAKEYENYCRINFESELQLKFLDAGSYRRILLRDVSPKLYSQITENLEARFNTELESPRVKSFLDQLNSANCTAP